MNCNNQQITNGDYRIMNFNDCISFANENKLCFLATSENNQPRVRALSFWFADETGFYFQTSTIKPFYNELKSNPKTEVCFYKHSNGIGSTLRVSGEVEFVDDFQLKERVLNERHFLKSFGLTADSPRLIIFKISHGQAHFWTMEDNLKPKEFINF
jgi:pyridoxamine 5'-phosphate oxidase